MLASCAQPTARVDETSAAPLPVDVYAAALERGAAVYRVATGESVVIAAVGRDGRLKHLGHDHAVASESVQGFAALHQDRASSHADIAIPIRDLLVDEARHREPLELDSEPSAADIAGTYTNMLKVFEPESWPWATVSARFAADGGSEQEVAVSVALHGASHVYLVPVSLSVDEQRVVVDGALTVKHSDFGIEPFSAAGGLLRVADDIGIRFHLVLLREVSIPAH